MKTNMHFYTGISRSILLRIKNVSDKICTENQNILCSTTSFENRAVYEKMWKHG